jgi:thymidylate synthase (FAD)
VKPLVQQIDYVGKLSGMPFQIKIEDSMGDRLTVINAARASFNKHHEDFDEVADIKLMNFLAREEHTMPFRHCYWTAHLRMPEIVARQFFRHLVGSDYTFKDTAWSEMSGRYVPYDEIFIPGNFHLQHPNKKQGASSEVHSKSEDFYYRSTLLIDQMRLLYNEMIDAGIAKEEARFLLPGGIYTEFYWTASLQAIAHFIKLRSKPDAQSHIQDVANVMHDLATEVFGNAFTILYSFMEKSKKPNL